MFRQFFKVLVLAIAVSAIIPVYGSISVNAQTKFSCGSDLVTYAVTPLDNNHSGPGIRCVKFTGSMDAKAPYVAWYGEGVWDDCSYRHVGQGFYKSSDTQYNYLTGYSSDIYGNGECAKNSWDGSLNIKATLDNSKIYVTGPWNELWTKVDNLAYTPLNKPLKCGDKNGGYFDQYYVVDSLSLFKGGRFGAGLRCVLKVGGKDTTWFGNGLWNTTTYSHLGTKGEYTKDGIDQIGYGASDIKAAHFGSTNASYAYGSLTFYNKSPRGFYVKGAWRETWF